MIIEKIIDIFLTVLGVLAAILKFAFYFYKKNPSLIAHFSYSKNGLILNLRNNKDVTVNVKHIRLVRKVGLKLIVEPNSFFCVVPSDKSGFQSTQDDELNIELRPNSEVKELHIDYCNLKALYDYFIPYENCGLGVRQLSKATPMVKCHIAIYLTSGKIQYISLPLNFYIFYRDSVRMEFDEDFLILKGQGKRKIYFSTIEHEQKYKDNLLKKYEISCRNYYLLDK